MSEFLIQLLFDKNRDGRIHVHSPNMPGLHLAGDDLESIQDDIEPIVKELLLHNSHVIVDQIRWVPSLEEIVRQMGKPSPEPEQKQESKYLVIMARAA